MFKLDSDRTLNKSIYEIGDQRWDIAPLRKLLESVLLKRNTFEDFAIEYEVPKNGRKKFKIDGRFEDHEGDPLIVLEFREAKD